MSESDKKRARKKVKKLQEKASGDKPPSLKVGTGSNAKANPQPPNINPGNVRCFIRYNNMGTPYRICSDNEGKKPPKKPPSQITPQISPEEFATKHGGYSNLTDNQRREYHRLDMRERRGEEMKAREKGEKFIKEFREERKRQRKKDANLKQAIKDLKKKGVKVKAQEGKSKKSDTVSKVIKKVNDKPVLLTFD